MFLKFTNEIVRFVELFCSQKKSVASLKLDLNKFFTENSILTMILSILSTLSNDPHQKIIPHFSQKITWSDQSTSLHISQDTYWSKGTGYSTGSITQQWDANDSMNQQQKKQDHIAIIFEVNLTIHYLYYLRHYLNPKSDSFKFY